MCRPFHVVPYSTENLEALGGPSVKVVSKIENGRRIGARVVVRKPIPTVRVVALTEKEEKKLLIRSPICVIDDQGFLRHGTVEYEPRFASTNFLELKIRFGKSERATIRYTKEGREGPLLVREAPL